MRWNRMLFLKKYVLPKLVNWFFNNIFRLWVLIHPVISTLVIIVVAVIPGTKRFWGGREDSTLVRHWAKRLTFVEHMLCARHFQIYYFMYSSQKHCFAKESIRSGNFIGFMFWNFLLTVEFCGINKTVESVHMPGAKSIYFSPLFCRTSNGSSTKVNLFKITEQIGAHVWSRSTRTQVQDPYPKNA